MQVDADGTVWPKRPAKTNAERQRDFRRRNPDYYRRLQAKRRAAVKELSEARREAERVTVRVSAIVNAYQTMPLMLPAPVEPIEIPGITTLPLRDAMPAPVLIEALRRRDAA